MPAGEPFAREIESTEAPDELQRRVVAALSALLAPANYKLAAQDAQCVEYRRQYRPRWLVSIALAALAIAVSALVAGVGLPAAPGLGGVALGVLVFARRTEVLRVAVEPRPGGSVAVVRGHLNGRGRLALLGLDPLSRLPFHEVRRDLRLVEPPAMR